MKRRIHITGASGSGTTTLGAGLGLALDAPHHDTDNFYWMPTDPPYAQKRPIADRLSLMQQMFIPGEAWVLSGSCMGWGDPLIPHFDLVVMLTLPADVRLGRLKAREAQHYGDRIAPGGDMAEPHAAFMTWAAGYDDPAFKSRSRQRHDAWLNTLPCAVLRLDSTAPVANLTTAVLRALPD